MLQVQDVDNSTAKAADAFIEKKFVAEFNDHKFVSKFFTQPTFCGICKKILWGVKTKQALYCQECGLAVHNDCVHHVAYRCFIMMPENSETNQLHAFSAHNYKKPTFCSHCGSMLYGLFSQGLRCKKCKTDIHKRCENFVRNTCRANKLEPLGRILLSITVTLTGNSNFYVKILAEKAKNLPQMDIGGQADPYLVVYVRELKSTDGKIKGSFIKNTLNPCWNEIFQINVDRNDSNKRIIVEIWDKDSFFKDDFIGCLSFTVDEILLKKGETRSWFKIMDRSNGMLGNIPIFDESLYENYETDDDNIKMFLDNKQHIAMSLSDQQCPQLKMLNVLKILGTGGFGKVYLVRSIKNPLNLYALKKMKKEKILKSGSIEIALTELYIHKMKSNFIVNCFMSFQNETNLFLLTEFVPGGDLLKFVNSYGPVSEGLASFFGSQIVLALEFLHNNRVIYRDLKLENCVITASGYIKLTDFGLSRILFSNDDVAHTRCGTCFYVAPEVINRTGYKYSVDFWSLGVLLYVMVVGKFPFFGSDRELFDSIVHLKYKIPYYMSDHIGDIIKLLLVLNPEKRLGISGKGVEDLKNHKFFSSLNWNDIRNLSAKSPCKPLLQPIKGGHSPNENLEIVISNVKTAAVLGIETDAFERFDYKMEEFEP